MTIAAQAGDVQAIKLFLERGDDVNEIDTNYSTPLIHLAWNGHLKVAEVLVEVSELTIGLTGDISNCVCGVGGLSVSVGGVQCSAVQVGRWAGTCVIDSQCMTRRDVDGWVEARCLL